MKTLFARFAVVLCLSLGCMAFAGCGTTSNTIALVPTPPVSGNIYSGYTQSYTVPWVGSPGFSNLTTTLKVQAQINGGTLASYTVDTGSVGVVVPYAEVPNVPANSPAGSITYTSSGLQLTGVWATMPVTFPQAVSVTGGATVPSSTVPVLAVKTGTCTGIGVNAGNCTGGIPHMLGIGFGRGTDVYSSPVYNVALNLTEMNAFTMRRGYVIGRQGLYLGLTPTNASSAFVMQTLTLAGTPAAGTHSDWVTPAGSFALNGVVYAGSALLDTGLLDMILEGSSLPSSGSPANNTAMTITLGTQRYSFAIGDNGVQTPTSVGYASYTHGAFVNTGLRALGHYDLLFDADGGYFGLRPE